MQFRTTRHLEYILENYSLMTRDALALAKRELDKRKRVRTIKHQSNVSRRRYMETIKSNS